MGKNSIKTTLRQMKKQVKQTCYCCGCGKNSIKPSKDLENQETGNLEDSQNQGQKDDALMDDNKRHCHRKCGCRLAGRTCTRCLPMLTNPKWCDNQKKSIPDDENSSSDREENEIPNAVESSDEYEEDEDNLQPLRRNTSSTGNPSQNKRNTRSSTRSKELNSKQRKIATNKDICSQTDDQETKSEEAKKETSSLNPSKVPLMQFYSR